MNFFNQLGEFFSNVGEQATYYGLIVRMNALYYQGQFDEAIELGKQAVNLARKIWGNEHFNIVITLSYLSSFYKTQGKYSEAEPFLQESLDINKRLFPNGDPHVANSLNNLALLYMYQGKYSEAEPLYQESLAMYKRLFPHDHPDVAASLNNLAEFYRTQERYREAEPVYQESLNMKKRLFPGDSRDVTISLNNLALLYLYQGKYKEAEPLYQESLAMSKRLFPGDNSDVASYLNNLATFYYFQGCYKKAESFCKESLEMRKRLFSDKHPDVAESFNNLAFLYHIQARYSEAEPFYQESLAILKYLFPNDHFTVAVNLNNLAAFYEIQGSYSKAEVFYKESLAMIKRIFPGDNSHVATILSNLALLYHTQGRDTEIESLNQEVLAMRERLFLGDHPDIAQSLNNLAVFYYSQERYNESESHLQKALEMTKRLFLGEHPDIARTLNNLALVCDSQGRYSESETFYQESLAMYKRLFPNDHPNVAGSLNNLGRFYNTQGRYSESETFYQESLAMYKNLFPNGHPDFANILNNLASLYAATNLPKQALEKLKEATEMEHRLMSQEFVGSSENDRMRFLDNIRITQYALLSLVYQYFYPLEESEEKSQAIHTALDLVLKRKALSNAASAAFNAAMYSDRYPQLKDDFQTWRERWQQIINLQSSLYLPENFPRLEANKELLNQLYIEVETLEKNITAEVPELRLENQLVDRTAIALELPANSTLIEFAYFPLYDFTTQQYQNPRYLAFILPAKQPDRVQMIDLGEADKIDELIGKVRQACYQINLENMGPSWKTAKAEPEPQNPFVELTTAIFKPLQNYLQGQQLFICPDGAVTLIPFQILPLNSQTNQLLIDQYDITYLTAGRDLLRYKYQPNRTASESLVIADPNFDLSVNEAVASANPIPKEGLSINLNSLIEKIRETLGTEDQKPFSPVPMTREIAEAVAAQFKVNPLLQNDALKTYLTNGKCPHKLVLATHGFFLPQNDPPQPPLIRGEFIEPGFHFRQIETTENPLLRSGLALAGANTWWLGGEILPEAAEGIVFAQEVAGFDLWANELIILIACETAVGDVKIGEGVKGLRSAFTAAGARVLIMSLWSVPAQVSIILMNRFFVNINQGKLSGQKALQEAQNYIRTMTRKELESLPTGEQIIQEIRTVWREKYPELLAQWEAQTYPLQARYFWGAWVCVGS